jgi:integrase
MPKSQAKAAKKPISKKKPASKPKQKSPLKQANKAESFAALNEMLTEAADTTVEQVHSPDSTLVPFTGHTDPDQANGPRLESVDITVAMAGLSVHTQRAYKRWIKRYLADVNQRPLANIDVRRLDVAVAVASLTTAPFKAWLGVLKSRRLGKQSIMQAKAAVVWLGQFLADLGSIDYAVPSGLSRVKAPRAESGQRAGTWLTQDEIRALVLAQRRALHLPAEMRTRNTAIIVLMVTCGLRRDEVATTRWSDLGRQGRNAVLRVHGKGEKLRVVKLPDMALQALDEWREQHPNPKGDTAIFTRVWRGGKVTTQSITDRAVWMIVQQAARRAGLSKVSPHDLRRSFARGAYEAGVSFELIRQTLGHSNIATTERYVNSVLELDHAATDIWANLLDSES